MTWPRHTRLVGASGAGVQPDPGTPASGAQVGDGIPHPGAPHQHDGRLT
jgi:hypothetical protein